MEITCRKAVVKGLVCAWLAGFVVWRFSEKRKLLYYKFGLSKSEGG